MFFYLFVHVCGLEAHKRLQINAPGKLPKDRAVPRGEDAAAVKGYSNVLKPSPAWRNNPSFLSMLLQGGGERLGWGKVREVSGVACPDASCHHGVSPRGMGETLAPSLLPSHERWPT